VCVCVCLSVCPSFTYLFIYFTRFGDSSNMCVRLCVRRRFRVLIDWRNRPGQSDSKNGNRSGLRTGGQTGQGGAGVRAGSGRAGQGKVGQGSEQGRAGPGRGQGRAGRGAGGRAGAPTGDFIVAFGHGHPLV